MEFVPPPGVDPRHLFHSMELPGQTPEAHDNARQFVGTGTPFLMVPGCRAVTDVWVRETKLPEEIVNMVPMDADGKILERQAHPCFLLVTAPDGIPVLLRSKQSNDGIWQENVAITVAGEWDEAVPKPKPPPKESTRAKSGGQVLLTGS